MTTSELFSITICAVIGFLIVTYFLRSKADQKKTEAEPERTGEKREAPVKEKTASWYEVLEVPATATASEIKNAYHRQIQKYHPDKVSGLGAELQSVALRKTQEITAAYHQAMRNF